MLKSCPTCYAFECKEAQNGFMPEKASGWDSFLSFEKNNRSKAASHILLVQCNVSVNGGNLHVLEWCFSQHAGNILDVARLGFDG